jgi:hypothetical protein
VPPFFVSQEVVRFEFFDGDGVRFENRNGGDHDMVGSDEDLGVVQPRHMAEVKDPFDGLAVSVVDDGPDEIP